jgi:hypothetical protein
MAEMLIVWEVEGQKQAKVVMNDTMVVIGRHASCDIVLGDPHVSRRHATIYAQNGGYVLHNVSRTNPVVINGGKEIQQNMVEALEPGDTIRVGMVSLQAVASLDQPGLWRVRCATCGHILLEDMTDCPWCGRAMTGATTIIFTRDLSGRDAKWPDPSPAYANPVSVLRSTH